MFRLVVFASIFVFVASYSLTFSSPGNYTLLCNRTGRFKCHCPEDDTSSFMDCSNNAITDLPNDVFFPNYVAKVTFQRNDLTAVPNTVFSGGIKVSRLDFSYNRIRFLADNAFANLESVEFVDLSHNEVWTLSMEGFHGIRYLSHLDLSYNRLNNFFSDVFKGCDELKVLTLKYNPMLFLETDTFGYLPGLKELDLTSLGLADLPTDVFASNTNLETLHLTANSFPSVPTKALSSAKSLKTLDLSENPITKLKAKSFVGLDHLESLSIKHMRDLSTLEDYSLSGLPNLKELYLTDNLKLNKISGLALRMKPIPKPDAEGDGKSDSSEEDRASGHPFLQKLYLRHNALQWLPEDLVDWKELSEIDLRENPWQCDCRMAWVPKQLIDNKAALQEATCASPKRLLGRQLSGLVDSDYTCSYLTSEATVALAVLVVAAFLLALAGTGFLLYRRSLVSCKRRREPRYTRVVSTKDKVDLEWDHTGEPHTKDSEA